MLSRQVAKPLVQLRWRRPRDRRRPAPAFPDSNVPEVAHHILALRAMHEQLDQASPISCGEREEPRR